MIPLLAPRTLTLLRYGSPVVANGVPTRPTPTETAWVGSVQPAPSAVLMRLQDGVDATRIIVAVSYADIRTASEDTYPDRLRVPAGLDVEAGDYEVIEVQRSPAFGPQPKSVMVTAERL